MPEAAPEGVFPLFIRGTACEKHGFKVDGEWVNHVEISKEVILKEIQDFGVMSDFEPAKKQIDMSPGDELLFSIDKEQKYGEMFLLYFTESSRERFMNILKEIELEKERRKQEEIAAEEARKAAEWARLNVVFEDVPLSPRVWPLTTSAETESEIKLLNHQPVRERLSIEIYRQKSVRSKYRFADYSGLQEFRAHKDPHFTTVRESEIAIQAAPCHQSSFSQTTWYRQLNKSVQYEAAEVSKEPDEGDEKNNLCEFLESATLKIELALQQNETVDIFHETFRATGDEEMLEGPQADNELRETKNFADPTYSKSKVLAAIDWMPRVPGMVAVSAVRNMSFDERVHQSGQTNTSYILLWDFRQLVRPQILLQSPHEIFTFRFNATNPNIVVGGCLTGQVMLWDVSEAMAAVNRRGNRGKGGSAAGPGPETDEDDNNIAPVSPKWVSNVDHSHKRPVADMLWLPPTVQINHRGQVVSDEHLDNMSHQFVTVAGDGQVIVWDTRYEAIANDELRHIARAKHAHFENGKGSGKEGARALWVPVFRAHLKRTEGVGELSLCKVSSTFGTKSSLSSSSSPSRGGDPRSLFMVSTEEGDVLLTDLSASGSKTSMSMKDDEDEDASESKDFVRWISKDLPRPAVCLQHSPFFPDIILSVGDLKFNLWKIGEPQPMFTSPLAHTYLTGGSWSPTRPAVLILSCTDGSLLAWDFTDSSYRHSIELKPFHARISSLEFLPATSVNASRQQLLAVGDVTGTLHIFEVPRNLSRPVHKEESIMANFFERELKRVEYLKENRALTLAAAASLDDDRDRERGGGDSGTIPAAGGRPDGSTQGDVKQENAEAMKKEEDEFAKLEAKFIEELSLSSSDLPAFLISHADENSSSSKIGTKTSDKSTNKGDRSPKTGK